MTNPAEVSTGSGPGAAPASGPGPAGDPPAVRELLLLLAAGVAVAAMIELALIAHWQGRTQALAWVAAHAGLSAAWLASGPTGPRRLLAARGLAAGAAVIGATGVVVHLTHNLAFTTELHPELSLGSRLLDAAQGGLPLLAPASLALPGLLVALATWRHPDSRPRADARPEWPGPGRWGNLVVAPAVVGAGSPAHTPARRAHRGLSADRGGGSGSDPAGHPEPAGEAERLDPADEP